MSNFGLDVTSEGSPIGAFELLFSENPAPITWWAEGTIDRWDIGTNPVRSAHDEPEPVQYLMLSQGPTHPPTSAASWNVFLVPLNSPELVTREVERWLVGRDRGRAPDIDGSTAPIAWRIRDSLLTADRDTFMHLPGLFCAIYPVHAEYHK